MNEVHLRDFKKYNLPYNEYMKQYFIGHYNPRGITSSPIRSRTRSSSGSTRSRSPIRKRDPQTIDFKRLPTEWNFPEATLNKRPTFKLSVLTDSGSLEKFLAAFRLGAHQEITKVENAQEHNRE